MEYSTVSIRLKKEYATYMLWTSHTIIEENLKAIDLWFLKSKGSDDNLNNAMIWNGIQIPTCLKW